MMKIFKDTAKADERCAAFWDMSNGILPIPRRELNCPSCRKRELTARRIRWRKLFPGEGSQFKFRCDLGFKCMNCSAVVYHGIVIPREMWVKVNELFPDQLRDQARPVITAQARDVRKILDDLGVNYEPPPEEKPEGDGTDE